MMIALAMGLAFFIDISIFENLVDIDYSIFYDITTFNIGLASLICYYFLTKSNNEVSKCKKIVSFIFAIFMIVGESYVTSDTYKIIFTNIATIIFSIIKIIGFYNLFKVMFNYLDEFLYKFKNKDIKFKNKYLSKYLYLFDKYPFRTSLVSILIVWSIYLIAFYPIVLSPDPSYQIKQYFNVPTKYINWVIQRDPNVYMTTHHPVLQTYLLGFAIEFGRSIINDNFGLFTYTAVQTLIYSSTLAYSIKFAKKNGVSNKLSLIVLLMYLFVPMYGFYTVSAVKDVPYTIFMMLYVLFIFDCLKNYSDRKISYKYVVYLFFVMLLLSLFRHNGNYIIIMSLPILALYSRHNIYRIGLAFACFLVAIYGFDKVLVPSLGISEGSIREMLSIPFQQTARLAYEDEDAFSESDIEIIDKILGFDDLGDRYNAELSDPVKNEFNKNTTTEDLKEYFKVWSKGLVNHFDVYVDATLNNIYGYFYPNAHNWYLYSNYNSTVTDDDLVDFHYNDLSGLRDILVFIGNIFPYIPVIGLLSSIGFNTWFLIIITIYIGVKKYRKYLICLIPLYGSLLFCVIGPANTYFRYTMPYVFLLPILTILFLTVTKNNQIKRAHI